MGVKEKFLKALADRMTSEDLGYLICRYMLVNDSPEFRVRYSGDKRINGVIIRSDKGVSKETSFEFSYAGDGKA